MKEIKKLIYITLLCTILCSLTTFCFASENPPDTYAEACVLMESSTGRILYEKNANQVMYPASTTKIMTAILALEHCNLNDIATVSYDAIYSVPYSYVHANLQLGEELTIEQLLHILLIPSANDAANVLAEHIGGSVDSFATMMNAKATEIGCKNTHFVNANGIHNAEHVSTAYDMALIGRYAMQNSVFRNIVSKTNYTLPTTNKYDKLDRVFNTTNELIKEDYRDRVDNYYYKYAIGIKTGYTDPAKSCIVAAAQKDGLEYIVSVLGAGTTENGLQARPIDCKNLFEYAFNNFTITKVKDANSVLKQVDVAGATKETKTLDILVQDEINILTEKSDANASILPTIEINSDIQAPVTKNSVVGKITYTVDGVSYTSNLLAGNDVIKFEVDWIKIIFRILLVVLLLSLLTLFIKSKRNRRGKRKSRKEKNEPVSHGGNFRNTLNNF